MKKSKGYFINFILIIVFTFAGLIYALKDNYQTIISLLQNISKLWFLIIISWGIFYTFVIAAIYRLLAKKYKKNYSMIEAIENAFVGSFFAGITPSATGGQLGQLYVMKKQGIKVGDAASLLWADFIIYQTTMMAYVTILFLLVFGKVYQENSAFFTLVFVGYAVNAVIICALWTMALFPKLYVKLSKWVVVLLAKFKLVKNQTVTLESWNTQLHAFTLEIQNLRHEKQLIFQCVLINIFRLTMLYSLPYFICIAMGAPLPLEYLIVVIAMSSFVTMANTFIPIPGASGGTEWAFVLIFSTLMRDTLAKSVMILWRFSTYHFVMIVGGLVFILIKRKYGKPSRAELESIEVVKTKKGLT